ncbi:MAG: PA0069 family radical SAM protein [Cyclobacteriaceae bacterium]|nr:PA0069 family radical SAM protein [Cyclobacteriaceae bacterium]
MINSEFKGRGSQIKPNNPFSQTNYVKEHIEGLDEELIKPPKTQVFFETPKNIINKIDSPDLHFRYSVNPYQGCEHGCVYCYARNSHQYWGFDAGLDFESKIIVKKSASIILEKTLLQKSWKPSPVILSGNTDCYQPLEKKYKLTRQILEVFLKYRHPVGIITKNTLVTRDIDVLSELAKLNLVHVFFSMNTLNEKLRNIMEPRTSSTSKKLKAMEKLTCAGIPVGVMNAPIIPGLNHHEIPAIIKSASEHGAKAAGYTVVRLNGSIGEIFSDWVTKKFPNRKEKILNQIAELHGGQINDTVWKRRMSGSGEVATIIARLFQVSKERYLKNQNLPLLNTNLFRKGGNYQLF